MNLTTSQLSRFMENVPAVLGPAACWPWKGATISTGYGSTGIGGKTRLAHRVMYAIHCGVDVDGGHHIHHKCHNPICVNPNHLEDKSPGDHSRLTKMEEAQRTPGSLFCKNGHPLTAETTYVYKKTRKFCRICHAELTLRRYHETKVLKGPKAPPTHCRHGHEYTPENTYLYRGRRYCRACHSRNTTRYYHESKPSVPPPPSSV